MSQRTAIIDSRRLFSFYRMTADNRIAFGGGRVAYKPFKGGFPQVFANPVDRPAVDGLLQDFRSVFPQLATTKVDYAWRGAMGFTVDNLPIVGQLEMPNVYFCGAWCGHGLALSIANGARLADLIVNGLGSAARAFPWDRNSCLRLPRPSVLAQGLKLYLAGLRASDRAALTWQRVKPRGNWSNT
jgi:gamma-glutamylputrescine oxidase